MTAWDYQYSINPNFSTGFDRVNTFSIYGWDSLYSLAYALDIFDQRYNIKDNILRMNSSFIISQLNDIIINDVQFLSVTGNVSFLHNGDRANGLYAFGNVIDNDGKVEYFGYFTDTLSEVQFTNITWYVVCHFIFFVFFVYNIWSFFSVVGKVLSLI